ncbi:serine/threonine-protein kinase PLK1-like [Rhopalosiphum padi]|uniref:serine/threonine-protein kinase PLK1-like n=1 Tax=Rhopalosiphum padi TaxID=40932 RepID=UPI00298D8B90|nr:serine/threonine-protein kinase PLK1-like [Rhopalosiphum padi]XP_060840507.1 serine/threonine-protein kinase PLK1-like [Rhopalosiphum padi]XP_060840508.1 serine/threonine-protein kinase PLK1-like [Rhopalosiphum padi]
MSKSKEDEVRIPDVIIDNKNNKKYQKCSFLGKGGFAKCYEIIDMKTKEVFAGKIVSKKYLLRHNQKDKMTQEIFIHKILKNKNIVSFHSFFEDNDFVYIILELCRKRSMMELHKRRKILTEPETRYYVYQILEGTLYLHQQNIIHRDLKLGNLFLNDEMEVKIGDLGLAAKIEYDGQRKKTLCGTPNYIAPEILKKTGHSFEVDVWSIGCIMYTLLVGKPPFETNSLKETYARITRCDYNIPSHLNKNASTLIEKMLQFDPKKRPLVSEIMKADFFTTGYMPKKLPPSCLTMAPRFDSIKYRESISNRRPLIELNSPKNIVIKTASKPQDPDFKPLVLNLPSRPGNGVSAIDCKEYMISLEKELRNVLKSKSSKTRMRNMEETTDPVAQPLIWVSKWVDYSDKYGFGYELSDDCVGVMFNDFTRIVLLANLKDVHYIEKNGSEQYYTIDHTPPTLEKKMKLLMYFRRYMNDHLVKAGADILAKDADQLSRTPYLYQWYRSTSSVILQLTNGTLQINFTDHTKVILCPLMNAVTFVEENIFRTYRFNTIAEHGCTPEFEKCLVYAHKKIISILKDNQ